MVMPGFNADRSLYHGNHAYYAASLAGNVQMNGSTVAAQQSLKGLFPTVQQTLGLDILSIWSGSYICQCCVGQKYATISKDTSKSGVCGLTIYEQPCPGLLPCTEVASCCILDYVFTKGCNQCKHLYTV